MPNQNDFSFRPPGTDTEPSPVQLPTRGERRIVPTPISSGNVIANAIPADFDIRAALRPFTDFVVVKIPHRGVDVSGRPDPNLPAYYRFLINPANVTVSRRTLDSQSLTRAGWLFGVWGEDFIQISLSGKTAGQYFAKGLTDYFQEFTLSYRNLQQLMLVFDNNGYFFEGEKAGEGPLAADFTRRRIKMHQDVQLTVGNFIWYGMFETLTISQDAESPYLADFNLSFIAWKERFRSGSPYRNSGTNDIQRGHSYGAYEHYGQLETQRLVQDQKDGGISNSDLLGQFPTNQDVRLISPAETSAIQQNVSIQANPSGYDYSPTEQIIRPTESYWNGFTLG
jgi:hypothetical protein